jgi:carbonic anhydrase
MEKTEKDMAHGYASRRDVLKLSGGLAAWGALGAGALTVVSSEAEAFTSAARDKLTPEGVLDLMKKGNERFRKGKSTKRGDFLAQQKATAKGQFPGAVLLSCIDSRAPAEVIMDLGIGDIFNCRLAGNIANDDILGSMEFACKVAGAKVVLVMGHTACGAIAGTIDNAELGNLTGLLAKIRPAVAATTYTGDRTAKNAAFVDAVAKQNVQMTMADIRKRSQVLADMESAKSLVIAGAMYDIATGGVDFF